MVFFMFSWFIGANFRHKVKIFFADLFFRIIFALSIRRNRPCWRVRERVEPTNKIAEIAQLVEHDLAKVGVASSSLVFRSGRAFSEALEK